MTVSLGNGVDIGNIVTAETNPLTGRVRKLQAGNRDAVADLGIAPNTPVLIMGGDHPYNQWLGANGDGMLKMYQDHGIANPYIAINSADSVGTTDMVSWDGVASLYSSGADIVAHGERHYQDNSAPSCGISVRYVGVAASATVQVTGGNIVAATTGSVDDFSYSLSNASYDTIAELVSAIDALANWTCTYSSELTGAEASTKLLSGATRDAKTAVLDIPAGGSISIKYNGSAYRNVWLTIDTTLRLWGDGIGIVAVTVAGSTLSSAITALNAISGVTATLSGGTTEKAYLAGTEDLSNITKWQGPLYVHAWPIAIDAGLSSRYILRRNMQRCKDVLAANGTPVTSFAQSGGNFYREFSDDSLFMMSRGNNQLVNSIVSMPQSYVSDFINHTALTTTDYTGSRGVALIDALGDSPGHVVCALIHKLSVDGSSGYSLPTVVTGNHDQTEAQMVAILAKAKSLIDLGQIASVALSDAKGRLSRNDPGNFIFNPRFKNSGESLSSGTTQYAVPGWTTDASNTSALTITDGVVSVTASGSSSIFPIKTQLVLKPGVYEFSADVDIAGYVSGEGVSLVYGRSIALVKPMDGVVPGASLISSRSVTGNSRITLRFVVDQPKQRKGYIISAAESFNLSTNKAIKLNIFGKGALDNLDCSAGASSSASVRAHEIAAAINAAVKASALYGAEYHNCARAENGRVIIEAPVVGTDRTYSIKIQSATTADAINTIFGSYFVESSSCGEVDEHWSCYPVMLGVKAGLSSGAIVKFSNPTVRSVYQN